MSSRSTHQGHVKSLSYLRAWSDAVLSGVRSGLDRKGIEAACAELVGRGELRMPTGSVDTEVRETLKRLRKVGRIRYTAIGWQVSA